MWLICLLISHVDVAHGYFAYLNEFSFACPEHLVHEGVAWLGRRIVDGLPSLAPQNKAWIQSSRIVPAG